MRHGVDVPPPSGADGPAPPLVGARFHAGAAPADPPADDGGSGPPRFSVVLRGYARRQVDQEFEAVQAEMERVRAELREEQRQRQVMWAHAAALEAQLRRLQTASGEHAAAEGPLADKLVRMARRDAARIRAAAEQEASQLLEEAREQADKHRRDVERLIAEWASSVERHVVGRLADAQGRARPGAEPARHAAGPSS